MDAEIRKLLTCLYTAGYQRGHHDTVEGGYADVHYSDRETYFEDADSVLEVLRALEQPASAAGDAARDGGWVLVPRRLTDPATAMLADFDMDDIGNNRGDAAIECWDALLDLLGRPAPELKFSNPIFHAGTNLTVRRGAKWHKEEWAAVRVGDASLTVRLSNMTQRFSYLDDHWVRDEHDPACRTVAGLLAEMKRVYPGFKEHEEVTLVRFDLPAVGPTTPEARPHD